MDLEVLAHKSRHKSFTQVETSTTQLEIFMGLVIFNLLKLFKKKGGGTWYVYDAGCSCSLDTWRPQGTLRSSCSHTTKSAKEHAQIISCFACAWTGRKRPRLRYLVEATLFSPTTPPPRLHGPSNFVPLHAWHAKTKILL
jgi:hypothetical protein